MLQLLFGDKGLLHATADDEFQEQAEDIKKCVQLLTGNDKFTRYMANFLEDIMINGIIKPSLRIGSPPTWTNNNCESVNHTLKAMLN